MAAASYDQLLKQVEALKMENSNLRQELEDNSNHLTKLETEASNMKVRAKSELLPRFIRRLPRKQNLERADCSNYHCNQNPIQWVLFKSVVKDVALLFMVIVLHCL